MLASENNNNLNNLGIVFISPIIGLTKSMMDVFDPIVKEGAFVVGVDIFDDSYEKKTFWKVLKLTVLPGAYQRRIKFANSFPESRVFDKIEEGIKECLSRGKSKIVLGGMSGGFVFAGRVVQEPSDEEIKKHSVRNLKNHIVGLFGISPLIFYPQGVVRPAVKLEHIPPNIRTLLFICDDDEIVPEGTLEYAIDISEKYKNVETKCLNCEDFNNGLKPLKHNFFGGKDFIGFMKNRFWHPEAERCVLEHKMEFFKKMASYN
ncbi:MAG: hypothetical protein Q8Q37_02800 [bacterium]|nr:hypothetical protein [bacterium]